MFFNFFYVFKCTVGHRVLNRSIRRQRQMCLRDRDQVAQEEGRPDQAESEGSVRRHPSEGGQDAAADAASEVGGGASAASASVEWMPAGSTGCSGRRSGSSLWRGSTRRGGEGAAPRAPLLLLCPVPVS